jgi:protein phosphatase PTC2/3
MEIAIREGCDNAENAFMQKNRGGIVRDKSGSCAIICILTESHIYVANIGDSRAIISKQGGR